MGAIRGILLIFVSVLFLVSVFSSFMLFTLSSSLKYDNVKVELTSVVKNIAQDQLGLDKKINETLPLMKIYCQTNSEYVMNYLNYTVVFPCETILQGGEAIIDYGSNELIKSIYYQKHTCSFFQCFKQEGLPTFLISEQTRVFLLGKFYMLLALSAALFVLMFLLAEKKANAGILSGILVILSALPLTQIDKLLSSLAGSFSGIVNIFFSASHSVFLIGIIAGSSLLVLGIIFRLFGIGMKISNFISRFKKKREQGNLKYGRQEVSHSFGKAERNRQAVLKKEPVKAKRKNK